MENWDRRIEMRCICRMSLEDRERDGSKAREGGEVRKWQNQAMVT